MRIGIVTTWFERGAGMVSRQLHETLTRQGHDVLIYARGERSRQTNDGWNDDFVHWGKPVFWIGSGKIDRVDYESWLEANRIECVIFNEQRWWQPIIWTKRLGVKTVAYIDYYTEESIDLFEVYDFLICNTLRHYSAFEWHSGAHYIPWGTNTNLFSPKSRPNRPLTFFHSCGWDTYRKGTDLVVNAFEKAFPDGEEKLVIHAQGPVDIPYDLRGRVEVILKTVPAPGLYHLGDIYLYPSRLDGIGLTICEAMACGLPVVTTNAAPMSEFIDGSPFGNLVPVRRRFFRGDGYYWRMTEVDIEALIRSLKSCRQYFQNIDEVQSLTSKHAREYFDWDINSSGIGKMLEEAKVLSISLEFEESIVAYDQRGWKGKLDFLLGYTIPRAIIEFLVQRWRRFRQPHFYSA